MKTLFILNDPPYGSERDYNALRLAGALAKRDGDAVRVFLMGDAAGCAKAGQALPNGYYNLNRMLHALALADADRRVRQLYGRPRAHVRRAGGGRQAQQPRRAERLDPVGPQSRGLLSDGRCKRRN
jgi:DsrE/DsrF-like family